MENRFRRIFGLPPLPEGYAGSSFRMVPQEDSELLLLEKLSDKEQQEDECRIHKEGARGRLASRLAASPWSVERSLQGAYDWLEGKQRYRKAMREIGKSRWVYFDSPYVMEKGFCTELEGWLRAPGGPSIPVTITTTAWIESMSREEWKSGRVWNSAGWWGGKSLCLVVPSKTLSEDDVLLALQHWYMESYGWEPGHWSVLEGRLPSFRISLEWQDWREYYGEGMSREQLKMTDQEYKKERQKSQAAHNRSLQKKCRELYSRFGLK